MLSTLLTCGHRAILVGGLFAASQAVATSYTATSSTFAATFAAAVGGDTIKLVGSFGETRLSNRTFGTTIVVDASQAHFTAPLILSNVSNFAFKGGSFDITGLAAYTKAIIAYGGSNLYVDHVSVIGTGNEFGVAFNGSHNAQVTNSKFSGLSAGIAYGAVAGGFVSRNTITGAASDGIDIADSHRVNATGNSCSGGSPAPGAHPDCIQLWSVAGHAVQSDITVSSNTAYGPTQGFTSFQSGGGGLHLTFSNNLVDTSFSQGVACYNCVDSTITNNKISTLPGSTYQSTLNVVGGSGNIVSGNTIAAYNGWKAFSAEAPLLGDGTLAQSDDESFAVPDFLSEFGMLDPGLVRDGAPAIPEPSSWAMMIAGFAAVGIARRRASTAGRPVVVVA